MTNKFYDFEIGFDEKPKSRKHRTSLKTSLHTYFCEVCDYEIKLPSPKGKKKHLCPNCKTPLIREYF